MAEATRAVNDKSRINKRDGELVSSFLSFKSNRLRSVSLVIAPSGYHFAAIIAVENGIRYRSTEEQSMSARLLWVIEQNCRYIERWYAIYYVKKL